jgi:putative PIN family toxin of toxin-antitoxin system
MSFAKLRPIVFDTNVFISAAILPNSKSAEALIFAIEHFEIIQSEASWMELQQVIARPKLNRYLDAEARHDFLQQLIRSSRFIESQTIVTDCTDPKDNKFLELAIDDDANLNVSGDRHLLTMTPFRRIGICTPGDFLRLATTS